MTISKKYTAASAVMLVLLLAAAFLLFSPQSEGMTANAAGISLSSSQLSLGKGETCRLSVKGNYGSVKWQSSDSTVASVSGGSVTAKKNGVAVISAADKNGNTAKCRITVKNGSAVADMVIFLPNGMSGFVSTRNQFIQAEKNGKVKDVIVNICGRNGKDYYVKTLTVSSTGASSVNSKDSYGQATPPSECQ